MCLSSEPTVIKEHLCFIGSGGGSSSIYVNRLCMLKMNIIIQQIKLTNEKQLILYQLLIMFDQLLQSVKLICL